MGPKSPLDAHIYPGCARPDIYLVHRYTTEYPHIVMCILPGISIIQAPSCSDIKFLFLLAGCDTPTNPRRKVWGNGLLHWNIALLGYMPSLGLYSSRTWFPELSDTRVNDLGRDKLIGPRYSLLMALICRRGAFWKPTDGFYFIFSCKGSGCQLSLLSEYGLQTSGLCWTRNKAETVC